MVRCSWSPFAAAKAWEPVELGRLPGMPRLCPHMCVPARERIGSGGYVYGRFYGGGGGHFWGFDAKWEVFRPFSEFLMDVGGPTSENMGPPYFGHGESKNQGFRLI